jgi:hypothetical protein
VRLVPLPSNWDGAGYYRVLFPAREMSLRGVEAVQPPRIVEPVRGGLKVHYGVFQRAPDGVRLARGIDAWLLETDFDVLALNQRDEPGWAEVVGGCAGRGSAS